MLAFEADKKAKEIFEAAFQIMGVNGPIRNALATPSAEQQFIEALSGIWRDYHEIRTQRLFFNDPTSNDVDQAANLMAKTIRMLKDVASNFPRLRNSNKEAIDRLINDLDTMIHQFKSAEIHQPTVGRRSNDPLIAKASTRIVTEFEHITGTKFIFSGDLAATKPNEENAFASEHAEFLYRLLHGIDHNIQRSSVATALKSSKQNLLQKRAKK
ncbi:hypothetical protein [Agrobacterium tumefaciens]|uniref:hypothetical protein n=1 Tax=Agrobacterium tumefaciens TaxID=358 RepID=UPI001573E667|nr:hypothetical protein [Agrobacterium tumefaciens]WCJ62745.1 hypothetical protein G6M15_00645 [Agrobacterium tumefaciens]